MNEVKRFSNIRGLNDECLTVVDIHPLPETYSREAHLMIVTANGLRIFIKFQTDQERNPSRFDGINYVYYNPTLIPKSPHWDVIGVMLPPICGLSPVLEGLTDTFNEQSQMSRGTESSIIEASF